MPKANITFIKPNEPSFIRKLKEQIGYKEGPTVDTKREALERGCEEDYEDSLDEQPTVVVINPGDLSAEEAAQIQDTLHKEEEETPANLDAPIIFKPPSKNKPKQDETNNKNKRPSTGDTNSESKAKKIKNKTLLSFDEEEDDD